MRKTRPAPSLNRLAASATLHCLAGCGVGEVLGMVISTALGWAVVPSIVLAVTLAFFFGYLLSLVPLLRAGLGLKKSFRIAFLANTASITVMEITDNAVILATGSIHAGLGSAFFWAVLFLSLAAAFVVAYPLNRWLIARGRGHALAHHH